MSLPKITIEEYFTELRKLEEQQPDGSTIQEMRDELGWSTGKVREALAKAKRAGRLATGRKLVEAIDGRMSSVPTYRILPPK